MELGTCKQCGKPIPPTRTARASYCSPKCKQAHASVLHRERRDERKPRRAPRICPHCEQSFIPTQARQRFCSPACGAHASKYRTANRETSDAWFTPEVRRVVGILTQQWPHQGQPYAGPY